MGGYLQASDRDAEPELTLKQQIRKELDDAYDSVKEFGACVGRS